MVPRSRVVLTLCASGLLALALQGGCAESPSVDLAQVPDGGGGMRATGGKPATGGTAGAQPTGGRTGTGGVSATGGGAAGNGGAGGTSGGAATFTQIYQTILTTTCTGSECHSPGRQGGVSFASQSSAYTSLKNRVVAGDPDASSLYALLNAGVMPPTTNNLSSDQLAAVASWIASGAANN